MAVAVAVARVHVVVGHLTAAAAALVEHGRRRRFSQAVLDALEGVLGAVRYARPGAHFLEFVPVVGQVQHRGLLFDRGLVAALRAPRGDEALDEHGLRAVRRPAQGLEGGAQVLDLPALQLLGVRLRVRGGRRRRRGRGRRWLGRGTRPPPRARARLPSARPLPARCAAPRSAARRAPVYGLRSERPRASSAARSSSTFRRLSFFGSSSGVGSGTGAGAGAGAGAGSVSASAAGAGAGSAGAAASSSSMAAPPDAVRAATSRSTSAGLWPSVERPRDSGAARSSSTFRRLSFFGSSSGVGSGTGAGAGAGAGAGSVSASAAGAGAGSAGAAASSSSVAAPPDAVRAATSRSTSAGL